MTSTPSPPVSCHDNDSVDETNDINTTEAELFDNDSINSSKDSASADAEPLIVADNKDANEGNKKQIHDTSDEKVGKLDDIDPELHRHPSGNGYVCAVCDALQVNRQSWYDHMSVHIGMKNHTCKGCNRRFWYQESLSKHQIVCSQNQDCEICDLTFKTRSELNAHNKHVHASDLLHNCTECDKSFSSRALLLRHMSTHSGIRPYACTLCDKRFTRQEHVRRHFQLHVSPTRKSHVCHLCRKGFTRSDSLAIHLKKCAGPGKVTDGEDTNYRFPADQTYLEMQEYRRQLYGDNNGELKTFEDLENEEIDKKREEFEKSMDDNGEAEAEAEQPDEPNEKVTEPTEEAMISPELEGIKVKQEPFDDVLSAQNYRRISQNGTQEDDVEKAPYGENYVYYPETEAYPNDDYVMDYAARHGHPRKRSHGDMEDSNTADSTDKPLYETLFQELGNNARIKKKKSRKSRPNRVIMNGEEEYDLDQNREFNSMPSSLSVNYSSNKKPAEGESDGMKLLSCPEPTPPPNAMLLATRDLSQPDATSDNSMETEQPEKSPSNSEPPSFLRSLLVPGKESASKEDNKEDTEKSNDDTRHGDDLSSKDAEKAMYLKRIKDAQRRAAMLVAGGHPDDARSTPSPKMVSLLTGARIDGSMAHNKLDSGVRPEHPNHIPTPTHAALLMAKKTGVPYVSIMPKPQLRPGFPSPYGFSSAPVSPALYSRDSPHHVNGEMPNGTSPPIRQYQNDVISTNYDALSTNRALYGCKYCKMWFEDVALSLAHSALHSKHDPWLCTMCGKKCKDKYDFMCHHINQPTS